MKTGLVSVTFRQLTPEEIIALVANAGLDGIEWGGDIHVPPGDLDNARAVGEETRRQGLAVAAYGSYCRLTEEERAAGLPEAVVEAARALGAPLIRVWAGATGSAQASQQAFDAVAANARRMAEMASAHGIRVAFEYHGNTLTDTAQSARRLLEAVAHPNMGSLWQPPVGMFIDECLEGIAQIEPYLQNMHAFTWRGGDRLPLAEGEEAWRLYLDRLATRPGEHYALLEFVAGDHPEQFLRDAQTLRQWTARYRHSA